MVSYSSSLVSLFSGSLSSEHACFPASAEAMPKAGDPLIPSWLLGGASSLDNANRRTRPDGHSSRGRSRPRSAGFCQTLTASITRWTGICATYRPSELPSTNSWEGEGSSSDWIWRDAVRKAPAYQERGRWYPVVVTIWPGAICHGISSAKGSRYFSTFRQTLVERKNRSISHVEVGPWSKQGWERLATNRPPRRRTRPTSLIAAPASSMSIKAMLHATRSTLASRRNSSRAASATRYSIPSGSCDSRARARCTIGADASTATTFAPSRLNRRERYPFPQPRSKTRSPRTSPTTRRNVGSMRVRCQKSPVSPCFASYHSAIRSQEPGLMEFSMRGSDISMPSGWRGDIRKSEATPVLGDSLAYPFGSGALRFIWNHHPMED